MNAAALERALRRSQAERRRRRLIREAYAPVYRRVAGLVPVVLRAAGQLHAYPIEGDADRVVADLAASCVFGFETALDLRCGRRLLSGSDVHAYSTRPVPVAGVGSETAPPRLVPILPRGPFLFLVVRETPPPCEEVNGRRVVAGDWLLREYLGALGHRFDLLAVVLHCVDPTAGT